MGGLIHRGVGLTTTVFLKRHSCFHYNLTNSQTNQLWLSFKDLRLYLQVLLESDGQDLSHDDGGSSSFSPLIPAITYSKLLQIQSWEWKDVVLSFWGREMSRGCVRLLYSPVECKWGASTPECQSPLKGTLQTCNGGGTRPVEMRTGNSRRPQWRRRDTDRCEEDGILFGLTLNGCHYKQTKKTLEIFLKYYEVSLLILKRKL